MFSKSFPLEQFERIYEICARVNSSLDLPIVLENIVKGLEEMGVTSRANLYLVDKAKKEIYNVASVGLSKEFLQTVGRMPLGEGSCGISAAKGEVVVIEDVEIDPLGKAQLDVARKENIRAAWYVPLISKDGKSIGALSIFYDKPFKPTSEQIRLVKLYANYAAISIENTRLYSHSQSIIAKLSNLQTAARQMTSTLKLDRLLEDICRLSAEAMGAGKSWIGLLEVGSTRVVPVAGYGYDINFLKSIKITHDNTPYGCGPSGRAIKTRYPVIVYDILSDPSCEPWKKEAQEQGDLSMVSLPLVCHGKTLGVLDLYSQCSNTFSESDLPVLMAFASQAAIAIENARVYETSRKREERAAILREISRAFSPTLSFDKLCWTIYEEVKHALNPDCFYISLYKPDDDSMEICFLIDEGQQYPSQTFKLDETPVLKKITLKRESVLRNRTIETIRTLQKGKQKTELTPIGNISKPSASLMFAPIKIGEKTIGVISAQSYTVGAYTKDHLELLTDIANQVSTAIEGARLEEKYKVLIENANDVLYVHDLEGNFLLCNRKFEEETGYSREEITDLTIANILPKSSLEIAKTKIKEKADAKDAAKPSAPYEIEVKTKDGHLLPIEVTSSPIIRGGKVVAIQGIARNISERKRMEVQLKQRAAELEDRNRRLKSLYELGITLAGDSVEVFNRIVEIIASVFDVKIVGIDELVDDHFVAHSTRIDDKTYTNDLFPMKGTPCRDVVTLGQLRISKDAAKKYPEDTFLRHHGIKSYAGVPLLERSSDVIGVLCIMDDKERIFSDEDMNLLFTFGQRAVSEIERQHELKNQETLRQKLIHADKMASIGRMIAGVAHELNNPLQGVLGYSELLLSSGQLSPDAADMIARVSTQAHRCKDIVLKLMKFARREKLERGQVNINELISEAVELRRFDFEKHNITIVEEYDSNLPSTFADPRELQSVFICIMDNAFDAMRESSKHGKLIIRTSKIKADMEVELSNIRARHGRKIQRIGSNSEAVSKNDDEILELQIPNEPSSKDYKTEQGGLGRECIQIEFSDNGGGIAEPDKVFDPFYSTKEVGKGIGLGLSLSYGIIVEHGGRITAVNDNEGAILTIILPITKSAEDIKQTKVTKKSKPHFSKGYKALIIDDEEIIVNLMRRILEKSGYEVDGYLKGKDAIKKLETHDYDVIITDVMMPGMDGRELYRWVEENKPNMRDKIVFSTADIFSDSTKKFLEGIDRPIIVKPFSIESFREVVSGVTRGTL